MKLQVFALKASGHYGGGMAIESALAGIGLLEKTVEAALIA